MKKSKLIEMLTAIKGNPEVKLWNGFVSDWVDVDAKLVPVTLVRMTQAYWLESCRIQDCIERKDWAYQMPAEEVARLKKRYTTVCKWEDNQYVTQEDIDKKRYAARKVQIMQAKTKGVKTWDRIGDVSY
jgi:hypothetical protein